MTDTRIHDTLTRLQATISAIKDSSPGAREQLISVCETVITDLELPSEAIQRFGWAEPARAAHLRIAADLGILEVIQRSGGSSGVSAVEIAKAVGADSVLIARILKHLSATHIISEVGPDTYQSTPLSNALTESKYRDGIIYTYDVAGPSFRNLPAYLKSIHYKLPTSPVDGPFQAAHKTGLPFFAWLNKNPPYLQVFNNYMSAYRAGKSSWVHFYPVNERLTKLFDKTISDILLVDVGGSLGHDLQELKTTHPLPGKLILQDRPEVAVEAEKANKDGVFEVIAHDFFTPQPVHGARAYYLHSVLHDWDDADCIRILEALKPAMHRGYSTLLLNEIVVPSRNAAWSVTAMDQLMLVLGAVRERTDKQWRLMLEKAGYKVLRIYGLNLGSESLIEAELL